MPSDISQSQNTNDGTSLRDRGQSNSERRQGGWGGGAEWVQRFSLGRRGSSADGRCSQLHNVDAQ